MEKATIKVEEFKMTDNGKQIETIMSQDSKQEATEFMDFLSILDHGEEKEMLAFLNGYKLGQLNQRREGQPA